MRGLGRRAGRGALLSLAVVLGAGTAAYAAPAAVTTAPIALTAAPAAVTTAPAAVTPAGLTISVSAITPAVARPGQTVTVTGTIDNAGESPLSVPVVRLVRGTTTIDTRDAVTTWAGTTTRAAGSVLASERIHEPVPAGGSTAFRLRVHAVTGLATATWGVLPVSVEAGSVVLHTFLGFQRVKEYEPLRTAWLVPITLGPDPDLWGPPGATREKAWRTALGTGSRLDRLVMATQSEPVTWAIDPLLLHPAAAPPTSATPSPTPTTSTSGGLSVAQAAGPEEASLRTQLAARLTALAKEHGPILLPDDDADIAAAAALPDYASAVDSLVRDAAQSAGAVDGRADVAWPAGGPWTSTVERSIASVYGGTPKAVVLPRSAMTGIDPAIGSTARTRSGTPLLLAEDSATATAAEAMSERPDHGSGAATEQVVATTAVVLGERPGVSRDLLLDLPRGADVSVPAAASFFSALGSVPWLAPTGVSQLVSDAAKADRTGAGGGSIAATTTPLRQVPASAYAALRTASSVGAQIRADGESVGPRWTAALEVLLSAQWRGDPAPWRALYDDVAAQVQTTTRAVHVSPQTISFLADRGRVQVTVVNDLDVEVQDVTVELIPDNPRLRIDSTPQTVRIGPHSRTTTAFDATALAAGPVGLTARILGPTGVEVGRETVVQVAVTPTGSWIYWALGGLAALAFGGGLVRNIRRRRRPTTPPRAVPVATGGAATGGEAR